MPKHITVQFRSYKINKKYTNIRNIIVHIFKKWGSRDGDQEVPIIIKHYYDSSWLYYYYWYYQ